MLVSLNTDSLILFSSDSYLLKKYEDNLYKTRNLLIKFFKSNGIITYKSFLNMINCVAPLEDEIEIYRFWNGYFFSEYFIDFLLDLSNRIKHINLEPFKHNVQLELFNIENSK